MAPVRAVWGFCPSAAAVPDTQHPQLHRSPSRHSPPSPAQCRLHAVSADRVKAKDLTEPIRAIVLNDFCESRYHIPMVPYLSADMGDSPILYPLSSSLLIISDAGIDVMMRRGSDVVVA
jgi:hypothetical protein